VAVKRPPDAILIVAATGKPNRFGSAGGLGLTDATSNEGEPVAAICNASSQASARTTP
jgi:hypothetical protein